MSYPQKKEYSIQEMIDLKDELASIELDLSVQKDLEPINWQQGNIAISSTHFYMTYLDSEYESYTVKIITKSNKKIDIESGFKDQDAAHDWIVNHHEDNRSRQDETSNSDK